MKAGILSPQWFGSAEGADETVREQPLPETRTLRLVERWDPAQFAHEQIRGLVGRVFAASGTPLVRQVVFSAIDAETDVRRVCMQVAERLATETQERVAIVGGHPLAGTSPRMDRAGQSSRQENKSPLRRASAQVQENIWWVPASENGHRASAASMHCYMGEIRREFEYSIVEGPPVSLSNEALAMAQFADGIILLVSAQHTRRMAARKAKEALDVAHVRFLGIVLCDREFPIPEGIYRRL